MADARLHPGATRLAIVTVAFLAIMLPSPFIGASAYAAEGLFPQSERRALCNRFEEVSRQFMITVGRSPGDSTDSLACEMKASMLLSEDVLVTIDGSEQATETFLRRVDEHSYPATLLASSEQDPQSQWFVSRRHMSPAGFGYNIELDHLYHGFHIRISGSGLQPTEQAAVSLVREYERVAKSIVDELLPDWKLEITYATTPLLVTIEVTPPRRAPADGEYTLRLFIGPTRESGVLTFNELVGWYSLPLAPLWRPHSDAVLEIDLTHNSRLAAPYQRVAVNVPLYAFAARTERDGSFSNYVLDMKRAVEVTGRGEEFAGILRAVIEAPSSGAAGPRQVAEVRRRLSIDHVAEIKNVTDVGTVPRSPHPGVVVERRGHRLLPAGHENRLRGGDAIELIEERDPYSKRSIRRDRVDVGFLTPMRMVVTPKEGYGTQLITIVSEDVRERWALPDHLWGLGTWVSRLGLAIGVYVGWTGGGKPVGVIVGVSGAVILVFSATLDYGLNPLVITFNSTALIDHETDTAVFMIDGTSQAWDWQRGEPIDLPSGHRLVMTPDGAIGPVTPFRSADLSDQLTEVLQHLQSLDERVEPLPPWDERADRIAVPGRRQGVLEAGAVDSIAVTLSQGAAVIATLRSPFFDTILELYDDQGRLIDANDDYDGTDSRLILDLPAGTYQFRVKSYWDDGAGAYTLETDYYQPPPVVVVDVTAPGTRSGFLAEDAIDTYRLTLPLPATVTVDLASKEFDTYLEALDAFGILIDANDDYHGTDSRLVLTLEAGAYLFTASSYWPSGTGAYTIRFGW